AFRVLRLPSVADKTFLVTIGDRTVGGMCVRDQMVGPWQVPVADCAVTAMGYATYRGEAMAIGERTPLALIDGPASGRMAVGDARRSPTPELRLDAGETELVLVDLGAGRNRLGASALAQVHSQVGDTAPDLDDPEKLVAFFEAIQHLNADGRILAYHDRSDG